MIIDQSRVQERSFYGEAVRLSNEFRNKPARTITDYFGNQKTIPAKTDGFDIETATIQQLNSYQTRGNVQRNFLKLVTRMKQGIINENIELLGETGYHPTKWRNLKASML